MVKSVLTYLELAQLDAWLKREFVVENGIGRYLNNISEAQALAAASEELGIPVGLSQIRRMRNMLWPGHAMRSGGGAPRNSDVSVVLEMLEALERRVSHLEARPDDACEHLRERFNLLIKALKHFTGDPAALKAYLEEHFK